MSSVTNAGAGIETAPTAGRKRFAAAFRSAAQQALDQTEAHRTDILIAGLRMRVSFAGADLYRAMSPAFGHVRVEDEAIEPDLDVVVWDTAGSAVSLPPEVGLPSEHGAHGLGQLREGGPIRSLLDPQEGTLTMIDLKEGAAVYWLPDGRETSERDRAAPLQTILNWWLPSRSRVVVHAAALGTEAGAVLLLGKSGAGKSTTSLACLDSGFFYAGDDLCAVTTDGEVTVHSLYCSAKIFEHNLEAFPAFSARVTNGERLETEKAITYVSQWRPELIRRSLAVRAVVVLAEKGCPEATIQPINQGQTLRALAPSTFHNFAGHGKAELAGLAELVSSVPCYELHLAEAIDANPRALRGLLESLTASR
jgi:hypothetical protein